jgi:flagellar motor switch protein FliN
MTERAPDTPSDDGVEPEEQVELARPERRLVGLADVPVHIEVRMGGRDVPLREVLRLGPGSVFELDAGADGLVDVVAGGRVIARGELVLVEDNLGVRITEIRADETGGEA